MLQIVLLVYKKLDAFTQAIIISIKTTVNLMYDILDRLDVGKNWNA